MNKPLVEWAPMQAQAGAWTFTQTEEIEALNRMKMMGGGFASALATAWLRADSANLRKLRSQFADLLTPYVELYRNGQ